MDASERRTQPSLTDEELADVEAHARQGQTVTGDLVLSLITELRISHDREHQMVHRIHAALIECNSIADRSWTRRGDAARRIRAHLSGVKP